MNSAEENQSVSQCTDWFMHLKIPVWNSVFCFSACEAAS